MDTAAVFVPVLTTMLAISIYSLITVISSTCLLLLLAVSASKTYTHVMIRLSKLPDSSSSDPLHKLYSLDMKISAEHVEKKDVVDGLVVKLEVQMDLLKNKMMNVTKKEEVVPATENKTPEKEE